MLEKEILEQLFRRYYSDMYYLARTLLGEDKEAEDIVCTTDETGHHTTRG